MAVTNGIALSFDGVVDPCLIDTAARVTIRKGAQINQPVPQQSRAKPDEANWALLTRFAQRTYAPSTEQSRLKGASAGVSDND